MIELEVNNGRTMKIEQDKARELIRVTTGKGDKIDRADGIEERDFVMLVNYYMHVKDNDINCDFINPAGVTFFK